MNLPRVNRVILTARATRDPELRYLATGVPVTRIPLAFEQATHANYITAVVTGPDALRANEELRQGGHVYLEGALQTHHWTTPDGVPRNSIEIRVEHIQILGSDQPAEPELPLEMPERPAGGA